MTAVVGAFNQEKALVGAFSVIVKTGCETDGSFYSTIPGRQPRLPREQLGPGLGRPRPGREVEPVPDSDGRLAEHGPVVERGGRHLLLRAAVVHHPRAQEHTSHQGRTVRLWKGLNILNICNEIESEELT